MGQAKHPTWFSIRPDGSYPVRGKPTQEISGYLSAQLRVAGLARSLWDAAVGPCSSSGSSAECKIFRVDNPHTKSLQVLGVVHRRRCASSYPGCASSWPKPSRVRMSCTRWPKPALRRAIPTSPGARKKPEMQKHIWRRSRKPPVSDFFQPNFLAEHAGHPAQDRCRRVDGRLLCRG